MSDQVPAKKRSCWLYGCISLTVFVLIGIIAVFFIIRSVVGKWVKTYTSTEPLAIEQVVLPSEEMTNLLQRVATFNQALEEQETQEELVLTATELNALIGQNKDYSDKVLVQIEDGKVTGQISLPLTPLGLEGKFLNGEATFKLTLAQGQLKVNIDQATVNGQKLPQILADRLSEQDVLKDLNDPELRKAIAKFDSIEVRDNTVILRNRVASPSEPASPSEAP